MSMILNQPRSFDRAAWIAQSLARFVQARRMELDLSPAEAAELAGMELSEWVALESGWIPADRNQHRAIAEVLRVCIEQIAIMALIAATSNRHAA